MEDLDLTVNLLNTSTDLEKASVSLRKIASNEDLDNVDRETLSWAGRFLLAMDWGAAQVNQGSQVGGSFAVHATSIRPTFYSCLFRIAPQLNEAGISSEKAVIAFLSSLYRNLISQGTPGRGHKKLTEKESGLGALFLHEMAESILVQINNNGLPRSDGSLNDDWQHSPQNEYIAVSAY